MAQLTLQAPEIPKDIKDLRTKNSCGTWYFEIRFLRSRVIVFGVPVLEVFLLTATFFAVPSPYFGYVCS